MRRRYCRGCGGWHDADVAHLCPAEDGDRTVAVPLAALRALVVRARWDDDWLPSYGVPEEDPDDPAARQPLGKLIDALGVQGL